MKTILITIAAVTLGVISARAQNFEVDLGNGNEHYRHLGDEQREGYDFERRRWHRDHGYYGHHMHRHFVEGYYDRYGRYHEGYWIIEQD